MCNEGQGLGLSAAEGSPAAWEANGPRAICSPCTLPPVCWAVLVSAVQVNFPKRVDLLSENKSLPIGGWFGVQCFSPRSHETCDGSDVSSVQSNVIQGQHSPDAVPRGDGRLLGVMDEAIKAQVRTLSRINGLWVSIWTNLTEKKLRVLSPQLLD